MVVELTVCVDPNTLPGVWVYRNEDSTLTLVGTARYAGQLGAVNGHDLKGDMSDAEWLAVKEATHRYNRDHAESRQRVGFLVEVSDGR